MEKTIAVLNTLWSRRILHAALLTVPLWLNGCNDKNAGHSAPENGANPLDLIVSITGNGRVTSSPTGIDCGSVCSASLASGSTVTLIATASSGFTFTGWSGDCSGSTVSCILTVSTNRAVTAMFAAASTPTPSPTPTPLPSQFTLTVNVIGSGTAASIGPGIDCGSVCSKLYDPGVGVTLTAVAGTGYIFSGWSGSGISCPGSGNCSVVMSANRSVTAAFTLLPTSGNPITLSLVPARTSGAAPLSVFFDATGTTDPSVTTRPFHDLEYRWDFGDASAGTWAYGAQPGVSSKNAATDPIAAHVFETPGTYTVSVTAFDGTNVATTSTSITVQDPNTVFSVADTVCVSTGMDFTGCPSGAITHTTSSFNTAMGYLGGAVHRLLFKAGDTWTGATDATISTAGPGLVSFFGTGAKPAFVAGTLAGRFLLVQANDWRIVGLDFDGNMTNPNSGGVQLSGDANTTVLNVHAHKLGWGVSGGGSSYDVVQEAVIDNIDPASSNAAAVYWTPATTSALLGNYINPTGYGDHVIRMGGATKFILSHNTLGDPGAGNGEVIKLHQVNSTPSVWDGNYTEKVIIADNHVLPITTAWQIVVAPQNDAYPEHLRDIIVERNWMESGTANAQISMTTIDLDGLHPSTVRNNILDMSTLNTGITGIAVQTYTSMPTVNNVRVYHNTCYSSVAANFRCVAISGATNTLVYNNLASAPNGSGQKALLIDGGSGTLGANSNLLNYTPSELFVNPTPTLPAHFALKSGTNPAVDIGTAVPVFDDFLLNARPNGNARDIGAYER